MTDLGRFCLCGGSMRGAAAPGLAEALNKAFDDRHSGEGHGAATPVQAARARRRYDIVILEEPA